MGNEFEKMYSPEEMEEMKKTRERVDNLEAEKIEEWKKNPSNMKENYELSKIHELGLEENEEIENITKELEETLKESGEKESKRNKILNLHKKRIFKQADRFSDKDLARMEAEALAYTDPLTGLGTRRALEDKLASMYLASGEKSETAVQIERRKDRRTGLERRKEFERRKEAGLIMIDIDFFKQVNDQFGHPVGDSVLREVAKRIMNKLKEILREGDELFIKEGSSYRFGGEEITVLLPGINLESSAKIAGRIREAISSEEFDIGGGKSIKVTISLGCGTIPRMPEGVEKKDLIGIATKQADIALYNAKETGRNKVVVWKDGMKGREKK